MKAPAVTNLVAFDGPGSRPKQGDVFVARLGEYLCPGRVVTTEAKIASMRGVILIYVFAPVAEGWTPEADRSALQTSRLLVPPIFINMKPWSYKLFKRVAQLDFIDGERLEQHCFHDSRGWYFDEHDNRLDGPVEPVGVRGLSSYRSADDKLSHALGVPRVPED